MTRRWLVSFVLGLSFLAACEPAGRIDGPRSGTTTLLIGDARLRIGESVTLADPTVEVSFDALSDSRCPSGVVCGVAGVATVRLTARAVGETRSIDLTLTGDQAENAYNAPPVSVLGHTFRLGRLDPYPVYQQPVPDPERVLSLLVD